MFELEPGLMIWTVVSFFLLLVLLKKVAYKPLLDILATREDGIRKAIADSEKGRVEAQEMLKEYKKQLDEAKLEARKIIEEGKSAGENIKKEIVVKAQEESNQVVRRAKNEIEEEKKKAVVELKETIADLSIAAAAKVINRSIDKKDHLQLFEEYISKVGVAK